MIEPSEGRRVTFADWPVFAPEDLAAASSVLESGKVNYWTGNQGRAFEMEFAEQIGVDHAVAVANGTVALEAAFEALEIGVGDEVILSPRTFMASGSSIVRVGATPIFADVDRRSGNLNAEAAERAITPRTKAILAVHLGGWPCSMLALEALARTHKLSLIEDCAQAHGGSFDGRPLGSWGRIAAWSFCQDKIMTTAGEGGMIATNDRDLWNRMWSVKDHGKSYDAVYGRHHQPGFRWLHETFGTNWRLTEVQSAIGRNQLRRLSASHEARTKNAEILLDAWGSLDGLRTERPEPFEGHAYYKFYAYVRPEALRADYSRDRIMDEVVAAGVPCFTGSCSEIYLEKAFRDAGLGPAERLPFAKELGETSLAFLVHPTLDEEAIAYTAEVVRDIVRASTR